MNHEQAIQEMATERYLLEELTPELRDAFEEHMFECQECALDVRAGNVFMSEAKAQLPHMAEESAAQAATRESVRIMPARAKKPWWSFLTTPAFAAPVFAALLGVIAFQNLSTIPSLRSEATEPRIIPWSSLHADTRGAEAHGCAGGPQAGRRCTDRSSPARVTHPTQSTCTIRRASGCGPGPSPLQIKTAGMRGHSHYSFQGQG